MSSSRNKSFTFDHAGVILAGQSYAPTSQSNGRVLIILHGLGEHSGRYAHVAAHFAALGYHVYTYDHEGHGRSPGIRGAIRSWSLFTSSITSLLAHVQTEIGGQEVFVYGHSMGAAVALDYLLSGPPVALAGVVASAPPVALGFTPSPLLVKLAGAAALLLPNATKSNELDQAALSRDAGVVSLYSVDPLNHDRISMRLGKALLDAPQRWLNGYYDLATPLLLMHGSRDRIADIDGTRKLAARIGGDVTLKEWDGLFHEVHNEPEQLDILAFTASWLEQASQFTT